MEAAAETSQYNGLALEKEGTQWMERIRNSEKREDDWRKEAEAAEKAYTNNAQAKTGKLYDFNILHSNVETIVPAIYNSTPIPDVRRRWNAAVGEAPQDPRPQIEQAAQQLQQQGQQPTPEQMQQAKQMLLQYQQQAAAWQQKSQSDKDAKDFGDMIERAIAVQIDDNRLDTEVEREAQDGFTAGRGVLRVRFEADVQGEQVSGERIAFEAVSWRDFRMGPSTRWENVPWVAFRQTLPRETLEHKVADKDIMAAQASASDKQPDDQNDEDIVFWEVWCKETGKVYFVREHDCKVLKIIPDPLRLKGFFPMPAPVQPIALTGKLTPVCPFSIYAKLADELDTITKRINKIMKGLKVRGIIAGDASGLVALAEADDNEIRVEANLEGLVQNGGLEKAIMWWPIEQAAKVLAQLYQQREIVKASIYEITGISDIVRGASNAGETATAQQIKTQWGSLRIQKMQRLIERQVRDIFCLMAEIIVSKFSPQTLQTMTLIEITPGMQALMQQPMLASYRVDVESDSTVRADLTRQKQDMNEFMTGTANYFGTMGPMLAQAPEAAEPVAEIFASMARVFKLGREAEDAIEKLKNIAKTAAKQPRPNPEAEKAKAEMAIKQEEAKSKAADRQAEMKMKSEEMNWKREDRQAEVAAKRQIHEMDKEMKILEVQVARAEADIKIKSAGQQAIVKAVSGAQQVEQQREQARIKAENARKPEPVK